MSRKTGHLLVVDDETALMQALCNTLRDEGYDVEGVTTGEEALARLRYPGIEVLLTDLMMPKMDGIALLGGAMAIDEQTVAILMTGHGSITTAVEAMKNGAIDYVLKPIRLHALLPVIDRALTIRRLRIKNIQLERRVRERTHELEIANQDLDAFCRSVSHDLRTPLRAIVGFTDLLLEHHAANLPPDVRRYLDLIHSGTGQMSQLITALLAFSRIGRQSIVRQELDLGEICREIFAELAGEYQGRRVELQVMPAPLASADPQLMRQVMRNLLSNAIKYSRPRPVARIEFGADASQAGPAPVYYIRDNGVGFDMRDAEKLFGVFQRLHYTHEFEGEGVGLATVRRIIEGHGGEVWAEAAPQAGATFFFSLVSCAVRDKATAAGE